MATKQRHMPEQVIGKLCEAVVESRAAIGFRYRTQRDTGTGRPVKY